MRSRFHCKIPLPIKHAVVETEYGVTHEEKQRAKIRPMSLVGELENGKERASEEGTRSCQVHVVPFPFHPFVYKLRIHEKMGLTGMIDSPTRSTITRQRQLRRH
jgi:hypothetical protein